MIINELRLPAKDLLTESCRGLGKQQRLIVEGIYREFETIIEATLTAAQVDQLFKGVEQGATAGGANRTMIGRGVDAASAVNQAINNVGKWLQNTAPVQAFDQKFEQLKSTIGQKFPGLEKNLTAMGTWAKANPGKTAAIIGVLTTIAALGAGPAGGAIAGQILRGTSELLQGQKLSTAVGKGVKTAALGALAGYTIDQIGQLIGSGIRTVASNLFPGAEKIELIFNATGKAGSTFQNVDAYGRSADLAPIKQAWAAADKAWDSGNYSQALNLFQQAKAAAAKLADPAYVAQLTQDQNTAATIIKGARNLVAATDVVSAAAQGAVAGAGEGGARKATTESRQQGQPALRKFVDRDATLWQWRLNESLGINNRPLCFNARGIDHVFGLIESQLDELDVSSPRAQKISQKYAPGAAAGQQPATAPAAAQQPTAAAQKPGIMSRIGQGLSTFGRQLTTKITAEKLNKAWRAAGAPTDSDKVFDLIIKQGVPDTVARKVYTDLNLTPPSTTGTGAAAPAANATVPYAPPVDTGITAPSTAAARPSSSAAPASTTSSPASGPAAAQPAADQTTDTGDQSAAVSSQSGTAFAQRIRDQFTEFERSGGNPWSTVVMKTLQDLVYQGELARRKLGESRKRMQAQREIKRTIREVRKKVNTKKARAQTI